MHAKVDRLSIQVPVQQNLTAFINDLTNLQDDITLILDDYHTISACCFVVVWYEMMQIANQQGDAGI
jgi:hypothetical protein